MVELPPLRFVRETSRAEAGVSMEAVVIDIDERDLEEAEKRALEGVDDLVRNDDEIIAQSYSYVTWQEQQQQ